MTPYLINHFTTKRLRNSFADFVRDIHLVSDLIHYVFHILHIPKQAKSCAYKGKKIRREIAKIWKLAV